MFARLPLEVFHMLGGLRSGGVLNLKPLVYARHCGQYKANTAGSQIEYSGNREECLSPGEYVFSVETIAEDCLQAQGYEFTREDLIDEVGKQTSRFHAYYMSVYRANQKLERLEVVERRRWAVGDKTGWSGQVWSSAHDSTDWDWSNPGKVTVEAGTDKELVDRHTVDGFVDVVPLYREATRLYNHRQFTVTEVVVGVRTQRGRYHGAEWWDDEVEKWAPKQDRHRSVGQFVPGADERGIGPQTMTYIPYTFVECECGDLVENWKATRTQIESIDAEGVGTKDIIVRYSGNKSFHIAVPSGMMGNPVGTVEDQIRLRKRLFLDMRETDVDVNLWDARHLVRMPGSAHEKTGLHVTEFWAHEFMQMTLAEIVERAREFRRLSKPKPYDVAPCPFLLDKIEKVSRFYVPDYDDVSSEVKSSGTVERALLGVAEHETWADKHTGRNKAAFIVACHYLKTMSEQETAEALEQWNSYNSPALPRNDLRNCLRSAIRTRSRETAR